MGGIPAFILGFELAKQRERRMTENELTKRAVSCKHWRWLPGILTLEEIVPPAITLGWDEARVLHADEGDAVRVCTVLGKARDIHDTALPDLTDRATLGCLLTLVREAWGWPNAFACHDEIGWCVRSGETGCCVELQDEASDGERYETESEALVAALEAAP